MYKFLLLLLLSVWGAPAVATVTLGEIDVRSFLNQPLQAQISAQGSGLTDPGIEVGLASEEVYRRAGMVRGALPSDLSIQLEGAGTSRLVRLTTQQPVREPYLGLLLEARWSAGRIFREYTILLDPPVAFTPEHGTAPVMTASVEEQPRRGTMQVPRAPAYTVRPGDTLGAIVMRQGYTGVSFEQAMLAILRANPHAFVGGNVNELLSGVELRFPGQDEVASFDVGDARQEIGRQMRDWRERSTVRTVPSITADEIRVDETRDERVRPVESEPIPGEVIETVPPVPAEQEVAPADRLEILTDATDDQPVIADAPDVRIFQEALLSQQTAMTALRDELRDLRSELAERDQLIRVVNDEFARLQERFLAMQTQMERQFAREDLEGAGARQRAISDPLVMLLGGIAVLLFLLLVVTTLRPAGSARGPRFAEKAAGEEPAPAAAGAFAPSAPTPTPTPTPNPVSEARPSPSLEPAQKRETALPARGAGAAAAAALVGAAAGDLSARESQRRSDAGERPVEMAEKSPKENQGVGLDIDDDLLADVDLYLAYGMNDQAISALEHAIRDGHDGNEYRVRLMDAYAANNDAGAARAAAADLRERMGPGDDELRERIGAVEERFRGGADIASVTGRAMAPAENERVSDGDLAWDASSDLNSLDFDPLDLSSPEETPEKGASEGKAPDDDSGILRFDIDEMDDAPGDRSSLDDAGNSSPFETGTSALEAMPLAGDDSTGFDSSPGTEMDTSENGMRLSLAEAFFEMDDREGALALLDEIVPTATAEQAAKAEELRRRIEGMKG